VILSVKGRKDHISVMQDSVCH